jgi:hypothetical protein
MNKTEFAAFCGYELKRLETEVLERNDWQEYAYTLNGKFAFLEINFKPSEDIKISMIGAEVVMKYGYKLTLEIKKGYYFAIFNEINTGKNSLLDTKVIMGESEKGFNEALYNAICNFITQMKEENDNTERAIPKNS